jgi:hypothetical protein
MGDTPHDAELGVGVHHDGFKIFIHGVQNG